MNYKVIKVNAGAGSGKTTTLVNAVVELVLRGVAMEKIFIASYTTTGVNEIKERIKKALLAENDIDKANIGDIMATTLNGFGYSVVCDKYEDVGLFKAPRVLTDEYKMEYIETLVNETNIPGVKYGTLDYNSNPENPTPKVVVIASKVFDIIGAKQLDVDSTDAVDILREELKENGMYNSMSDQSIQTLCDLYKEYIKRYKEDGFLTFSDQEPLMHEILDKNPTYLEGLGYEYIIIDEFQDSNETQVELLKKFTKTACFKKLIVVGDDAQAIFAFRETSPEFIINFEKYIGMPVKELLITENRRSVANILKTANKLISLNENRTDKDLVPTREDGIKPWVNGYHKVEKEYAEIISQMMKMHDDGVEWNDMAFIAYKKSELVKMGTMLSSAGIPWVMKNPMNLLENSRVQAALALADAFYAPDITSYYKKYLVAKYNGELYNLFTPDRVNEMIEEMRNKFNWMMEELEIPEQRIVFHQYLDALRAEKDEDKDEIYEYFISLLYANEDIQSELNYTRIFKKYGMKMTKRMEQDYEGVVLVTAHSSKGAEWKVVFNSITNYDSSKLHIHTKKRQLQREEMRRLLFVSMTRAKDRLFISGQYNCPKDKEKYNQFLHELYVILDKEYDPIDHEAEAEKAAREEARKKRASENAKQQTALINAKMAEIAGLSKDDAKKLLKKEAEAKKVLPSSVIRRRNTDSSAPTVGSSNTSSRVMTEEEKKQYNNMVLGAYQTSMF